jgi:hypothetical protein
LTKAQFIKQAYLAKLKKHIYLSKGNHLCLKQKHLAHCFSAKLELVFERKTSCNLGVARWRQVLFIKIGILSRIEEQPVAFEKTTLCVKRRSIYPLFPCEN